MVQKIKRKFVVQDECRQDSFLLVLLKFDVMILLALLIFFFRILRCLSLEVICATKSTKSTLYIRIDCFLNNPRTKDTGNSLTPPHSTKEFNSRFSMR